MLTPRDREQFRAQVLRRAAQIERRRARARVFVTVPAIVACLLAVVLAARIVGDRSTNVRTAAEPSARGANPASVETVNVGKDRHPWAAVTGPDGAVWVLDRGRSGGRPSVLRIDGGVRLVVPLPAGSQPESIDSGNDGALWLTDPTTSRVMRITVTGTFTSWTTTTPPSATGAPGADGRFWFAEPARDRLTGVTPDGKMIHRQVEVGGHPDLVTLAPDGSIWFAYGSRPAIGSMTVSGAIGSYPLPVAGARAVAMASGPGPALWLFLRGDAGAGLAHVDHRGAVVADPLGSDTAVDDLSLGPDGTLWFSTSRTRLVQRRGIVRSSVLRLDRALRADSWALVTDGSMWAVDREARQVVRILPDGT